MISPVLVLLNKSLYFKEPFEFFSNTLSQKSTTVNAMIRNTISLTKIQSGYKTNIIPEKASASLDIRLLPETNHEYFLYDLHNIVDDKRIKFIVLTE